MIADLARLPDSHRDLETDVVVIGAGIAGLILAARLRSMNIRVVVLESGGLEQTTETHPLNRITQLGDAYIGATHGRFRCLGGTSTRWGGALIPFTPHDLTARPYLDLAALPVSIEAIHSYLPQLEKLFGLDSGSYEEEFVEQIGAEKYIPTGDSDFRARFAKWPAFKVRNVATLFGDLLKSDPCLEVWLNCTATSFNVNGGNGRIESVTGRHESGRSLTVSGRHFAICSGAIESTRLLLLLDRQYDLRIFEDCDALGRYFYDHISIPAANIRAKRVTKLNRMAGFRFVGSTMRSLRFELSPSAQERECVGSALAHISFRTDGSTGFDTLRFFLRSLQQSGRLRPDLFLTAIRDVPYLFHLGLWRVLRNQLLWPSPATYELHVVAEQLPQPDNYISLSSETDLFGQPLAAINWRIRPNDCETFRVVRRCFDRFWNEHGLRDVGELEWKFESNINSIDQPSHADVYHPGGSTRMGIDGRSAVVDSNLRSFKVPNLWVASTSVFPSGGGANPTLTLMLFTSRLADHLGSRLKVERDVRVSSDAPRVISVTHR